MSDYEIYIAGFALIGWCFAGHYYIQTKQHRFAGLMLTRSLLGVALGKTKIEVIDGGLKITDLEDIENHGNTSNQAGQSEGTDRS
jgi:hypothetical protein